MQFVKLFLVTMFSVVALVSLSIAEQDVSDLLLPNPRQNIEPSQLSKVIQQKSPGKAFLLSAIAPGTGELYASAKRGVAFISAEIAFWSAYFVLHGRAEELKEGYIRFVDQHIAFERDSPVSSTKTWTMEDYEHATQTDNWHYVYTESNGKPIDRVGKFYWADLPKDKIDEPGDGEVSNSKFRMEAYNRRVSTNKKFKQAKVYLGLVVLNHVISAIDARISAKAFNERVSGTGIQILLTPTPSLEGLCLTLQGKL